MPPLVVATANIASSLARARAAEALRLVLDEEPDLVGLQEWYAARRGLLRASRAAYAWTAPLLGGCAVGVRRERLAVLSSRSVPLSRVGRADRGETRLGLEPARSATVVSCRDLLTGEEVALVDYHLVSGVQALGAYRKDRPRLVARHRQEVRRLADLVGELVRDHSSVHAVGDSNLHGLRLPGLTSAWDALRTEGTLGHRQVDDVFGPGPAGSVTLVETPSDHRAVVVRR